MTLANPKREHKYYEHSSQLFVAVWQRFKRFKIPIVQTVCLGCHKALTMHQYSVKKQRSQMPPLICPTATAL